MSTSSPGSRRRWLQSLAVLVGAPLASPSVRSAVMPSLSPAAGGDGPPPPLPAVAAPHLAPAPTLAPAQTPSHPQALARAPVRQLLQVSPVAGFQYHEGDAVWQFLRAGDPLHLVREPHNRFDERAVRLEWQGENIGYVPARDNAAVAQLLDRDESLDAVITSMAYSSNPWERLEFAVYWTVA